MLVTTLSKAPLKNALDWASRPPNVWGDKAAAIISTGGGFGGGLAQHHLRQIGVFLNLHFINKPEFVLNAFQPPAKFNDDDGTLIDPQAKERLKAVLLSLKAFTMRLQQVLYTTLLIDDLIGNERDRRMKEMETNRHGNFM
ncbi:NADPH:quinone oxidoreductase-like protein [Tanacetum coccineum]